MTSDGLKKVIASAFGYVDAAPPSVVVSLPAGMPSGYEGVRVQDFFLGRRRDEVTWKLFELEYKGDPSGSMAFMTPEAAWYYLPSMLNICIDSYQDADVFPLAVLSMLSGEPRSGFDAGWAKKFHSLLIPRERSAIRDFIQYMREHYAADMPIVDFARLTMLYD